MHEAQIVPDAASLIQKDLTPRHYFRLFVDGVAHEGAALQSSLRWCKGQHARAQLSLKQARLAGLGRDWLSIAEVARA